MHSWHKFIYMIVYIPGTSNMICWVRSFNSRLWVSKIEIFSLPREFHLNLPWAFQTWQEGEVITFLSPQTTLHFLNSQPWWIALGQWLWAFVLLVLWPWTTDLSTFSCNMEEVPIPTGKFWRFGENICLINGIYYPKLATSLISS